MELSAARTLGGFPVALGTLDVSDVFWLIPPHRGERRFFVTKSGKKYYVFLRAVQSSRGAPPTWSKFGASISRLTQGALGLDAARLERYVNDTFLAFFGLRTDNRVEFAIVVYLWAALGLPLTLHKADYGTRVAWTSGVIHVVTTRTQVNKCTVRAVVQVMQVTGDEVTEITTAFRRLNVVPVRDLRSYVGRCTAIASGMFTWTPLLKLLWAALTVEPSRSGGAPHNCVWVRRFSDSLE